VIYDVWFLELKMVPEITLAVGNAYDDSIGLKFYVISVASTYFRKKDKDEDLSAEVETAIKVRYCRHVHVNY